MPSGCVRIRTSSSSITTCKEWARRNRGRREREFAPFFGFMGERIPGVEYHWLVEPIESFEHPLSRSNRINQSAEPDQNGSERFGLPKETGA